MDDDELQAKMVNYSDTELWEVVKRPMELSRYRRSRELTALSKTGQLAPEQDDELEALVDQYDDWMHVRSTAMLILQQRGYDVMRHMKDINAEILRYYGGDDSEL